MISTTFGCKTFLSLRSRKIFRAKFLVFPEHVDHFMLVFISKFSVQREWIYILCSKQINIQNKIFVVEIFFNFTDIRNIQKKFSRFDSCCRIFFSWWIIILKKVLAFCWLVYQLNVVVGWVRHHLFLWMSHLH